jgi:hypothetical protein
LKAVSLRIAQAASESGLRPRWTRRAYLPPDVVHLRTLGIAEECLLRLWTLEKKLLQLLHFDSTRSKTWFLASRGAITRRDHRLLLSN